MALDVSSAAGTTLDRRGTLDVHSPGDGRLLDTVNEADQAVVESTVAALRRAQPEWERLGPRGRARYLARMRDWILDNEPHLLDLIQAEAGKVRQDAALETNGIADVMSYYLRRGAGFLRAHHPRPPGLLTLSKALTVTYRPYPVVGVIAPWNFPLLIPMGDSAPALMAGAAVVLKPSEFTPLTAVELGRGWQEIGAPDVFRVITGSGDTGAAVVENVDYVQFTGSAATGRRIGQRAGARLIPCSLELGGKDAMIVLDDADLDRAVGGALWGGFFNTGQGCASVERVYVQDGIYDRFVTAVVERTEQLRQGSDSVAGDREVGAMITRAQVEIVDAHIQDAVDKGARILTGGTSTPTSGNWSPPTVLVDVDHSMACMRDETFGPTLPIMRVRDADEAIELANDSPYGLSASIWTKRRGYGERLARRLEVGAVNVNDVGANILNPAIPMAGWRQSGLGYRFGGAGGLLRFCRVQSISAARLTPATEIYWYPYSLARSQTAAKVLRFIVGRGRRRFQPPGRKTGIGEERT
ncbi:aldehyde dehydrogenase family protein [Mycolicibacterium sp.]|uniref:aldehyde dehydrogenase family protein n=1 Tax=Mycolicibacterium sp. TaxID=2320850 RepID=UPI003D0F68CC